MPIICDKNLLLLTFSTCPVKCEFASVVRLLVCLLACRPLMKISLLFICLFLKNCQVSTFNFFCKKKKWLSPCHVSALKTFKVYNLKSWQGIQLILEGVYFQFHLQNLKGFISSCPQILRVPFLIFQSSIWFTGLRSWYLETGTNVCSINVWIVGWTFFSMLKNNNICHSKCC